MYMTVYIHCQIYIMQQSFIGVRKHSVLPMILVDFGCIRKKPSIVIGYPLKI